ncbi:MAG: PspC domain-containing protein [Truepera sp.]|nr:PspC domain-containing protein [Truepera sp.]MBS3967524.1 PspC domain-containing protein [Truepera sp.]
MNYDPDPLPHQQRRARRPASPQSLRRVSHGRWLGGVLGGIATFVGADPRWLRGAFIVALIATLGLIALPYLALWWLLPGTE